MALKKDEAKASDLMRQAQKLGISFDRTVTGEHGIGPDQQRCFGLGARRRYSCSYAADKNGLGSSLLVKSGQDAQALVTSGVVRRARLRVLKISDNCVHFRGIEFQYDQLLRRHCGRLVVTSECSQIRVGMLPGFHSLKHV